MLKPRPTITIEQLCERLEALDRLTDTRLQADAEKVRMALNAADKAIAKAEAATEKRFHAINEFRTALSDQTQTYITREVFNQAFATSVSDRADLRSRIEEIRVGQSDFISRAEASTTVAAFEKIVDNLRSAIDNTHNSQTRMIGIAVGLSAAITLVSTLSAIVFRLAGH